MIEPSQNATAEANIRGALERARGGDRESLPALREALDAHSEIWDRYGDLAAHAERAWVDLIAGPDLALAESLGRKVAAMKADLAGPAPSPLEGLLVGRIAACWLQVHQADAAVAQAGPVSIRQADLAQKRQARAHKGYLMAIASLATVRRLLPTGGSMSTSGCTTADAPWKRDQERDPTGHSIKVQGGETAQVEGRVGPCAPALFEQPAERPGQSVEPDDSRGGRSRSSP